MIDSQVSSSAVTSLKNKHKTGQISACIICRNEADKLAPCLESASWVDEILVMDLSSSDGSVELASSYGARVIPHEPFPIVEPLRNEIAASARNDWILALDPDERVTPGLALELHNIALREDLDAVVIPRMNQDLGYLPTSPIQRYEPQLRMYRRSRISWPLIPNTLPVVDPKRIYQVPTRDDLVLFHDRSRNIPEILERVIRYAPAQAESMLEQGDIFTARSMMAALAHQIDKEFFRARVWQDGVPGILRASILVAYKFYVWSAFWQLSGSQRTAEDDRFISRAGNALEIVRKILGLGISGYRFGCRLIGRRA